MRYAFFRTIVLSLGYGVTAYGTMMIAHQTGVPAAFWPANALAIGVILTLRPEKPWRDVAGCAAANAIIHVLCDYTPLSVLTLGVANGASIAAGVAMYEAWRAHRKGSSDVRAMLAVVVIAAISPIAGSVIGGLTIAAIAGPEAQTLQYVGSWWLVEAVAIVLIVPIFLFFPSAKERRAQIRRASAAKGGLRLRTLEFCAAVGMLIGAAGVVPITGMVWLVQLPGAVLLWFALRFGLFATATMSTIFAVVILACHMTHGFPMSGVGGEQYGALVFQAMTALVTLPALLVAAIASQREKARQALAVSESRLTHALNGANDGLWDWDFTTGSGFFSHRAATIFGYDSAQEFAAAAGWQSLIHEDDLTDARDAFDAHVRGETEVYEAEIRCRLRDGGWIWVHDRGKLVEHDPKGKPLRAVGTYTDISERKRLESALEELATTDVLTGLYNRVVFNRELEHFSARLDRQGGRLAVLLIDVDRFKAVNDTFGHGAGDAMLATTADRLRIAVRAGDVVARIGGDEFAVIAIGQHAHEFDRLAARLTAALAVPLAYHEATIQPSASIGVAVAATSAQAGAELVNRADRALYAAKRDGRGVWRFASDIGKVA